MKRRTFLQSVGYGLPAIALSSSIRPDTFIDNTPGNPESIIKPRQPKRFGDGRDWFFEKRFGMFAHWGLYSIPGWHEQHQYRGRVKRSEYIKLKDQWNPYNFNPDKWLDLMQEAEMKYLCFTTKHIDGFCMWDTKLTAFNTLNTPYKKDILGMLADVCHKRKIPLCLYYSIVDNNHPSYPNKGRAHEIPVQPGDSPDIEKYIAFLKGQVHELCTNYGEISGFWWDALRFGDDIPADPSINNMIRQLQPNAVINDRGFDKGDFGTPERDFEADDAVAFERLTEACQAVGRESWGFRTNEEYYTDRHLISSINRYLTRDANYLLNVGPMPDGNINNESISILSRIGKWYSAVKESLEDVQPASDLTSNHDVTLTRRNNTLYVHLNRNTIVNGVKLKPVNVLPVKATLLNNGQKVESKLRFNPSDYSDPAQKVYLNLLNIPVNNLNNTVPVIRLEFDCALNEIARPSSKQDGILK